MLKRLKIPFCIKKNYVKKDRLSSCDRDLSRLEKDLYDLHHTAYYTLTSIVQGVVLGYLFSKLAFDKWFLSFSLGKLASPSWVGYGYISLAVSGVLLVVLIWNSYIRAIFPIVYTPNVMDSLLLFLMGVSQVFAITGISSGAVYWHVGFLLVILVGIAAYFNMLRMLAKYRTENFSIYEELLDFLHDKILYLFLALIVASVNLYAFLEVEGYKVFAGLIDVLLIGANFYRDEKAWYFIVKRIKDKF